MISKKYRIEVDDYSFKLIFKTNIEIFIHHTNIFQ